jgi:hypothetical protein
MNITSPTIAPSTSAAKTQSATQLDVLRKTLNTQVAGAVGLLQALPAPTQAPTPVSATGTEGGIINTFA